MTTAGAKTPIIVRRAEKADASAACDVVRKSIQQLCTADHQGDEQTRSAWLENKTVAEFERIIASPSKHSVVALRAETICGFAHLNHSGRIGLLYVVPEARFAGVSTAMLLALEAVGRRLGLRSLFLESTATARDFYLARGYQQSGEPSPGIGRTRHWPMEKQL